MTRHGGGDLQGANDPGAGGSQLVGLIASMVAVGAVGAVLLAARSRRRRGSAP